MMNQLKKIIVFLCVIITGSYSGQTVVNAGPEEFKKHIDSKKGILIDLRTNDEIKNKGTIKGATQIDFLSVDAEQKIKSLDKTKTYYIFCAGGGRSSECADLMKAEGFPLIIHLEKGFDDWKRKGFPVEKKE